MNLSSLYATQKKIEYTRKEREERKSTSLQTREKKMKISLKKIELKAEIGNFGIN
jgi:hypothetical protein